MATFRLAMAVSSTSKPHWQNQFSTYKP